MWAVFIFLGCRFRSRWQTLSEEEMADCARGRSVRYLRVQWNAILNSVWYFGVKLKAIFKYLGIHLKEVLWY